MKSFKVCYQIVVNGSMDVQANSEEEAESKIQDLFDEEGTLALELVDEDIEFVSTGDEEDEDEDEDDGLQEV